MPSAKNPNVSVTSETLGLLGVKGSDMAETESTPVPRNLGGLGDA